MKKRGIVLASIITLFLIVGVIIFVLNSALFKPEKNSDQFQQIQPIIKEESAKKCNPADTQCEEYNRKLSIGKVPGETVEFVKHQCDGPRECPQPNKEVEKTAIEAIKKFEKESELNLLRITGINASGLVHYCAHDGRCWSFNTKTKDVAPVMPALSPTNTPSN
ncbi:MAG TPA: hypothetical protein PKA38_03600 [Candidatus Levybacteria bacterium]|nr:hypothetical protein [Candidatus Levybacteria bacterium]